MKVLLLMCFLSSTCIYYESSLVKIDSKIQIDFKEIKKEIEWFLDKVKGESIEEGRYNVYVVKIHQDKSRYCVTMGFIQDSLLISFVNDFKYYMKIGEELVLLDYSDDFKDKYELKAYDIKPFVDKEMITRRIYSDGVVLGTTPGYVCCFENGNIIKIYYDNSDDIPYDKAIFKYPSNGMLIELDSTSLKKIIRDKKKN